MPNNRHLHNLSDVIQYSAEIIVTPRESSLALRHPRDNEEEGSETSRFWRREGFIYIENRRER
jgi:hypothetical protein